MWVSAVQMNLEIAFRSSRGLIPRLRNDGKAKAKCPKGEGMCVCLKNSDRIKIPSRAEDDDIGAL